LYVNNYFVRYHVFFPIIFWDNIAMKKAIVDCYRMISGAIKKVTSSSDQAETPKPGKLIKGKRNKKGTPLKIKR